MVSEKASETSEDPNNGLTLRQRTVELALCVTTLRGGMRHFTPSTGCLHQLSADPRGDLRTFFCAFSDRRSRPARGHARYSADFSRTWTPQAEPRPITWARPTLAPSI